MNETHDFRDGRGPVPAHRHTNPGGTVGGWVDDDSRVSGRSIVGPDSIVLGGSIVSGRSTVSDGSRVDGGSWVSGRSTVDGGSRVDGGSWVVNGSVESSRHVISIGPIGESNRWMTVHRTDGGPAACHHGDWSGTIDQFAIMAAVISPGHEDEIAAAMALARLRIAEWDNDRDGGGTDVGG